MNKPRRLTFRDLAITPDGRIITLESPPPVIHSHSQKIIPIKDHALSPEDALFFQRPGIQHTEMKKLRRGLFAIEAELDLHGHTKESAFSLLTRFMSNCLAQQYRCVRVIHGKGREKLAILKTEVNRWLQQLPAVQAFCSAPANAGGTGAVIILLKRSNP
jgi:DNA-nicking Smr family endonuclease